MTKDYNHTMYTTKQVAEMTGLSVQRIQQYARTFGVSQEETGHRRFFLTDEDVRRIMERKGQKGRLRAD